MTYQPGSIELQLGGDAYTPPSPPAFRFGGTPAIIPAPPPRLIRGVGARWSRAAAWSAETVCAAWDDAPAKQVAADAEWSTGAPADTSRPAGWSAVPAREQARTAEWGTGHAADGAASSQWGDLPARDSGNQLGWDNSIQPTDLQVRIAYNPAVPSKDRIIAPLFQRSNEYGTRIPQSQPAPLHHPGGAVAFTFRGGLYTPPENGDVFFHFVVEPIRAGRIGPVDSTGSAPWGLSRQLDLLRRLHWGRARPLDPIPTGIEYPDHDGPITIIVPPPAEPDILETYMIANSVSLVVLPDRIPLDATGIRTGLDIDSFAWTLTANLFGRTSLALVRPDANGPKEVELTINGHRWVFIIERYSGVGKLADERYTITGVSQTQLLAKPYAPARSQSNTAPINAQQAAEFELQYTDFTLHWDAWNAGPPDWTLPEGAFSYTEKTAMQVIAELAETVGGIVSPSRDARELTVLPRYRTPVWQWSSAIMDRIIPADIVSSWGSEWQPQPEWNSCYVSGTNHGVSVNVRRAGTAGDEPAPDVYSDWLTGEQAGRARGIAELCKGGNQEIVTLDLPLLPEQTAPGLVTPGMLCEVRDIEDTWRGLCLATEITADGIGASRVKQTLKLERHHREGA
ncbi:hypothetical protein [Halopseudomonas bauzanensis]|uniref:hypothetical protein n=1 Tax=Halopseudomonas bauzanensis TaxID=653930 RepID=UPI002556ECF6|nr:hypothetical protein [Halopseudomonas bauzanensis]